MAFLIRAIGTLFVATVLWAVIGYFATLPLGAIFGWSGHPAIPAAPIAIYIGFYLGVLPVLSVWAGWRLVSRLDARLRSTSRG